MNLTIPVAASGLFSGSARNPEIEQAEADLSAARTGLDSFQRRLSDTDHLLSISRRDRVQSCSTEVGRAMWNQKAKFHAGVSAHLAIFSAAGLGGWALFSGLNPIVGLAAGAALTYGYVMAMKHIVLPMQIDKAVKPALEQEKRELTAAVGQCRDRVKVAEANLVKGITSSLKIAPSPIEVGEAAVTVGGVRLKVRK